MSSFYNVNQLSKIGFNKLGVNVQISRFVNFYEPEKMSIGSHVRIDDFCLLSGNIKINNYVHIATGSYIFGGTEGVEMKDYSGLSSRCVIYAVTDDYSGNSLTNPTVPPEFRNVIHKKVVLNKHVIVGTSTVILPGVILGEGCAVGAMSLVSKSLPEWTICVGNPVKIINERKKNVLELEKLHLKNSPNNL